MSILDPNGREVQSAPKLRNLIFTTGSGASADFVNFIEHQVTAQKKAHLIELLQNLRDGMAVFAAYSVHNELDEEQATMYSNLVEMARKTVKAMGYERVVEMADIMALNPKEQA